jgi:hypothetical protein
MAHAVLALTICEKPNYSTATDSKRLRIREKLSVLVLPVSSTASIQSALDRALGNRLEHVSSIGAYNVSLVDNSATPAQEFTPCFSIDDVIYSAIRFARTQVRGSFSAEPSCAVLSHADQWVQRPGAFLSSYATVFAYLARFTSITCQAELDCMQVAPPAGVVDFKLTEGESCAPVCKFSLLAQVAAPARPAFSHVKLVPATASARSQDQHAVHVRSPSCMPGRCLPPMLKQSQYRQSLSPHPCGSYTG